MNITTKPGCTCAICKIANESGNAARSPHWSGWQGIEQVRQELADLEANIAANSKIGHIHSWQQGANDA